MSKLMRPKAAIAAIGALAIGIVGLAAVPVSAAPNGNSTGVQAAALDLDYGVTGPAGLSIDIGSCFSSVLCASIPGSLEDKLPKIDLTTLPDWDSALDGDYTDFISSGVNGLIITLRNDSNQPINVNGIFTGEVENLTAGETNPLQGSSSFNPTLAPGEFINLRTYTSSFGETSTFAIADLDKPTDYVLRFDTDSGPVEATFSGTPTGSWNTEIIDAAISSDACVVGPVEGELSFKLRLTPSEGAVRWAQTVRDYINSPDYEQSDMVMLSIGAGLGGAVYLAPYSADFEPTGYTWGDSELGSELFAHYTGVTRSHPDWMDGPDPSGFASSGIEFNITNLMAASGPWPDDGVAPEAILSFADFPISWTNAEDSPATFTLGGESINGFSGVSFASTTAAIAANPCAAVVEPISVSVGDYVWVDTDKDGIQDAGEPGIPGVTLTIVDADGNPVVDVDGNPVGSVVTDENGLYSFDGLPAGTSYTVIIDQDSPALDPYVPTAAGTGDDRSVDSSTGQATSVVLPNDGDRDPTLDFGFVTPDVPVVSYAVGDYTWIDTDKDGVQDSGEPVLPGVKVSLYQDGEVVATTTTDVNGHYQFDELPAGEYQIRFELTEDQAAQYEFTGIGNGAATDDSNAGADGWTENFVLDATNTALVTGVDGVVATEGIDPTWDAGVVLKEVPAKSYAVGDYTWIDTDKDGVQDSGEPVLPGVKVTLYQDGEVVATTTTDENGHYQFDELPAGSYEIGFELTDEQAIQYEFTDAGNGTAGTDSNADTDGRTGVFVLDETNTALVTGVDGVVATEGIDPTWDAGVVLKEISVVKNYAVGDYTWIDTDKDGVQDSDEPVLPGVKVTLYQDGEVVATTVTDTNGHYQFDELAAGSYEIGFELTDEQAALYEFTGTGSGTTGTDSNAGTDGRTGIFVLDETNTALVTGVDGVIATEGIDPTWDAGVVLKEISVEKSYAVGDYTWIDTDKDGIQDSDEPVLPGVKVSLYQDGELVATTTTDENGHYQFDELSAGTYQIRFELTEEQAKKYEFTSTGNGAAGTDSNAGTDGWTQEFVLDETNTALVKGVDGVVATEGIDPTWDAGVVLKVVVTPEPTPEPTPTPSSSVTPTPSATPTGAGNLARTGGENLAGIGFGAGTLMLLGLGVFLAARKSKRAHSEG